MIQRKVYSATDAQPIVLHGKISQNDEVCSPVLLSQAGTLSQMRIDSLHHIWDYSGGTLVIYAGAAIPGTPTGSTAWILNKYSYDGNGNQIETQVGYDAWSNRGPPFLFAFNGRFVPV